MSKAEASLEPATSKPTVTPLMLARGHQLEIKRLMDKVNDNAGCIRQLLVGRVITCHGRFYRDIEVRMTLGKVAEIFGVEIGKKTKRRSRVGALGEIEIAP